MRIYLLALAASTLLIGQGVPQYTPKVDPRLVSYIPTQTLAATVESIGADSLTDIWEE
jgi:hypothetical protein